MDLATEQVDLLAALVEAARRVPRAEQTFYLYRLEAMGESVPDFVIGAGLTDQLPVLSGDLGELASEELIRWGPSAWGDDRTPFTLTNKGFRVYEDIRSRDSDPSAAIEQEVRQFLDGSFRERFPSAHGRLAAAEALLWQADPSSDLTTIGHKTREAVQQFATELGARYPTADLDPDPAKTTNRLRAIVAGQRDALGNRMATLLDALASYQEAVNGVIQRQEHGDQKEGEPLTWEDARATVFNTALLLHEYDRLLPGSGER
jgi:hypothetical protein